MQGMKIIKSWIRTYGNLWTYISCCTLREVFYFSTLYKNYWENSQYQYQYRLHSANRKPHRGVTGIEHGPARVTGRRRPRAWADGTAAYPLTDNGYAVVNTTTPCRVSEWVEPDSYNPHKFSCRAKGQLNPFSNFVWTLDADRQTYTQSTKQLFAAKSQKRVHGSTDWA